MMYQRIQNPLLVREGDNEDLRLLLIGKTGSGKSAAGNIIFNQIVFESKMSSSSVTRSCQTHTGDVNNRSVRVIDTPDFIFSTHTDFDSDSELKKALELCSPGAHVILLLLSLSTFTEQEMDFTGWFEKKFGEEALRFTVVLFTHAGQRHMRTLAEMIRMNPQLSYFINRCGGGFCEMNIKAPTNSRQVTELMQKIDTLISENTNSCYTLDMMLETERRAEEEKREEERRREKETRERIREKEWREREHQMELDRVRIETEISMRREFELKLEQEKVKIVENKEKAEKHSLLTPIKLKYVSIFMVCAVVSGGVLVWRRDSSQGWMFIKGFIAGGSVTVLTRFLWRLMLKRQCICSSSYDRPITVRQLFLETAGVACGGMFAGAVIHHFKGENLLHISVLAGAAGALTEFFLYFHFFTKMFK